MLIGKALGYCGTKFSAMWGLPPMAFNTLQTIAMWSISSLAMPSNAFLIGVFAPSIRL